MLLEYWYSVSPCNLCKCSHARLALGFWWERHQRSRLYKDSLHVNKTSSWFPWTSASVGYVINSLCFTIKAFDTFVTAHQTVDLSTPAVSPITCRKLPLTKNLRAIRTCCWGGSAWILRVLQRRTAMRFVMYPIPCHPNLNQFLSSSSVKFLIFMGGLNCLGLRKCCKLANNKSAISFLMCLYFSLT